MSNGMRNMPCASSVAFHIERNARKFPQRTALIDEYGSVTYAELDAKANQLANYLAAQGISHAVEEIYALPGEKYWRETVQHIEQFAAGGNAAIVSTISGDSNVPFFRELSRRGIRATALPVMTLSAPEALASMPVIFPVKKHDRMSTN